MPLAARSTSRPLAAAVLALLLLAAGCSSASEEPIATGTSTSLPDPAEVTTAQPPKPAPESTDATVAAVHAAADGLIAAPNTTTARAFLAAVQADGSERWTPWLIDLLSLQVSSLVSSEIGDQLAAMSAIPSQSTTLDLLNYGNWSQQRGHVGGEGYREFKATIYEIFDPDFGPFLRSIDDPVELAAIQWGSVQRGGIPELNNQPRVAATDADWMIADQVVMGVVINGEAVAYPLAIMQRHELANDVVGGEPIAIVYCTLCRTGLVFESNVDDQVLHFETSGLLLYSNKIMVDRETETLWHHLRGLGIGGEMLGTELDLVPVNHMRWSDWVAENPTTMVLTLPEPTFSDDPERPGLAYDYTPGEAYRAYYESDALWFPTKGAPDDFDPKTEVVGIEHNADSVAFAVEAFNQVGTTAKLEVGGEVLTIEPTGVGVRVFDPAGNRIISEQSFWFAWFANHPETRTWIPTP